VWRLGFKNEINKKERHDLATKSLNCKSDRWHKFNIERAEATKNTRAYKKN